MKNALIAAAVLSLLAAPADAALFKIDFSFATSGTPNPATGSVTIDNAFDSDVAGTVIGLTVNALNFEVDFFLLDFKVAYQYSFGSDTLIIGGVDNGPGGITTDTNDFRVSIDEFLAGSPPTAVAMLTQGAGFIAVDASTTLNITELTDDTGAVPLPATLPLVITALGLLGLSRRVGPPGTSRGCGNTRSDPPKVGFTARWV